MSVIGIIIIMLIIILGIISFIVDLISKPFKSILLNLRKREMKEVEKNISATIMTDPQKAFQMVVDNQNIISYSQYANLLTLIAEKSGHIGAMKKLIELYHGDILSCFADKDKYEYWLERVAKLGHIASIVEYYKFLIMMCPVQLMRRSFKRWIMYVQIQKRKWINPHILKGLSNTNLVI